MGKQAGVQVWQAVGREREGRRVGGSAASVRRSSGDWWGDEEEGLGSTPRSTPVREQGSEGPQRQKAGAADRRQWREEESERVRVVQGERGEWWRELGEGMRGEEFWALLLSVVPWEGIRTSMEQERLRTAALLPRVSEL